MTWDTIIHFGVEVRRQRPRLTITLLPVPHSDDNFMPTGRVYLAVSVKNSSLR